jgi:hypothetical protein
MAVGDSPANTHLSAKYLRRQAHSPIHLVDKRDIRSNQKRCAALDHIVTTGVLFNTEVREGQPWAPNTGHRDQYSRHRRTGQKTSPNMLQNHGTAQCSATAGTSTAKLTRPQYRDSRSRAQAHPSLRSWAHYGSLGHTRAHSASHGHTKPHGLSSTATFTVFC